MQMAKSVKENGLSKFLRNRFAKIASMSKEKNTKPKNNKNQPIVRMSRLPVQNAPSITKSPTMYVKRVGFAHVIEGLCERRNVGPRLQENARRRSVTQPATAKTVCEDSTVPG